MNEQEIELITHLNKSYLNLINNGYFDSNPIALLNLLGMYCFKENINNKHVMVLRNVIKQLDKGIRRDSEEYLKLFEPVDNKCDVCNNTLDFREAYDFTGYINEEFSKHIHVCEECYGYYKLDRKLLVI
jgi:uncharacterized protein with PIN domain